MIQGQGRARESIQTPLQQQKARVEAKLRNELGEGVCGLLADPDVIEIMANPDGVVWCDRLSVGMEQTEILLPESQIELVCTTVASIHQHIVTAEYPLLKAELPLEGRPRFQGMIRPVSPPTYVIRIHTPQVITMAQQIASGTITETQAAILIGALRQRQNIILVGATLSGKTVLADSLMHAMCEMFGPQLRLVVIEDTYELHVAAPNAIHLHTTETTDLRTLIQTTMRLRPDRIIVGEVRGAEALDLVKALGTGHPGGITTIHANSAKEAMDRLESLIEEAGVQPNRRMLANTINMIVMMIRTGSAQWRVKEILHVEEWNTVKREYRFKEMKDGKATIRNPHNQRRGDLGMDEQSKMDAMGNGYLSNLADDYDSPTRSD